jgi:hypothetical protein
VVDHLDDAGEAEEREEGGGSQPTVAREHAPEQTELPHAQVLHQDHRDPARREDDDRDEKEPEVEQPRLGDPRHRGLEEGEDHRADDRAEEEADAADVRSEEDRPGAQRRDRLRGHDLVIDRGQAAGDSGEERRQHEHEEAHRPGAVADELGALLVIADGVGDAPERRLRQREHRGDADEGPPGDQVVDLKRRAIVDAEHRSSDYAVAVHAPFAAEEGREHKRHPVHHLADAERDHRERHAGLARGHPADKHAKERGEDATHQRQHRHGKRELALADEVERVDREIRAEPHVDRVPEREQPGLPEQHVVGQREDDHDAHLAHEREREPLPEDERQRGEGQREQPPDEPAAGVDRLEAQRAHDAFPGHVSRVPISPRGRTISINTMIR